MGKDAEPNADRNKSTESETKPRQSSAFISGSKSDNLEPKNFVTVRSPFTKGQTVGQSPKSHDKASVDSVKSNNSVWRADKYVPNSYQIRKHPSNRKNRFKLIRVDWNELNSCATYSRIVTSVFSLFIIIIIVLNMNADNKDDNLMIKEIKLNETLTTDTPDSAETYSKYYLMVICGLAIFFETTLIVCYSLHIVEMASGLPWLCLESTYATLFALNFIILSIWMLFYGFWFLIVAFIGMVIAFIYLIWALIKISRYRSGQLAQRGSDDPDGDTLRRLSPNLKFSQSDEEVANKLSDERKAQNKDDILY